MIILFNFKKQIILLLKLPRAGACWFKESDNMNIGSSVSSVTKGILKIANPVEENKHQYVARQERRHRTQAKEICRMACSKGSGNSQCQWYNASLKSETFLNLESKAFFPISKTFSSTSLVSNTVPGLTE